MSTYKAQHNRTNVHVQTAGSLHKVPVPYSQNAARNRVLNEPKRRPPPFASTLDLRASGVANTTVYPYRTISQTTQKPTEVPMESRIGWTNCDITAGIAKREHSKLWR
jgi:hypothetical protein